jgi:ESF2/ABP1 family protein
MNYGPKHAQSYITTMAHSKRDYHDLTDEEDASEAEDGLQEESRFSAIPNKRRRLAESGTGDESEDSAENSAQEEEVDSVGASQPARDALLAASSSVKKLKRLTPAQLAASQRKAKKTGVVYISRVPPFMKPTTVRKLLSPYGEIGRIFLTPEPAPVHQKRVRAGGNKKKSFVDGWVEFTSKKKAKQCVELLNGNTIGGKKSGFYHDDIWNLKYLKGFKWSDLMEQVQVEERTREGRLRAELQREAKERKAFLDNLEIEQRAKKRSRKEKQAEDDRGHQNGGTTEVMKKGSRTLNPAFERRFRQNEVKGNTKSAASETEGVQRVLRSIF